MKQFLVALPNKTVSWGKLDQSMDKLNFIVYFGNLNFHKNSIKINIF